MKTSIAGLQWAATVALFASLTTTTLATPFPVVEQVQQPLQDDNARTRSPGHLHGRFMHITG